MPIFKNAWGYQGNAMALPVRDLDGALTIYERTLGFTMTEREQDPKAAILERGNVKIRLVENGGDPTQDGCAFEVTDIDDLHAELIKAGLRPDGDDVSGRISPDVGPERRDDGTVWRRFFVVSPDGLCYWFGEKQGNRE